MIQQEITIVQFMLMTTPAMWIGWQFRSVARKFKSLWKKRKQKKS